MITKLTKSWYNSIILFDFWNKFNNQKTKISKNNLNKEEDNIQDSWEVAYIYSFCQTFSEYVHVKFEIEVSNLLSGIYFIVTSFSFLFNYWKGSRACLDEFN